MRLGVLDVGSNTVHLLVVDARRGAPPQAPSSHKSVLRLMRYLEPSGAISDEGVAAVVDAVSAAVAAGADAGITEVLALVESTTGVRLQVLTGEDEARLTFLAVRRWFGWSAGDVLLLDIGGGSL